MNLESARVLRDSLLALGFQQDGDNFSHPLMPEAVVIVTVSQFSFYASFTWSESSYEGPMIVPFQHLVRLEGLTLPQTGLEFILLTRLSQKIWPNKRKNYGLVNNRYNTIELGVRRFLDFVKVKLKKESK